MEKTKFYQKVANVKVAVQKRANKKSGVNKYAGFSYFELSDFLPIANEEMAKEGLVCVFNLGTDTATLMCTDGENNIIYTTPTAEVVMGNKVPNPIQNLGAMHTYLKRYLYMNLLDLSENDIIDATTNKDSEKEEKVSLATATQIKKIKELYDDKNIAVIVDYYKVEKLEDLSVKQASAVISKKDKK